MNSLKDVLRAAADTGDWITPYAIWQVQAAWWALEVDDA